MIDIYQTPSSTLPVTNRLSRSTAASRSNRVDRTKSDMPRRRRGSLDGSNSKTTSTTKETGRGREVRRHRSTTRRRQRHVESRRSEKVEQGPRYSRSRTTSDIIHANVEPNTQPRRSQTISDVRLSPRKHRRSISATEIAKELQDSMTLDSLTKGIQMASSIHYSHRVRANLHSSFHCLEPSPRLSASTTRRPPNSRLSESSRRQRRREPRRRSSKNNNKNTAEENIRLLQFDCEKADGLNVVDANIRVMGDESVTEETDSLGNSFSSGSGGEDDQRLLWNPSEDSLDEQQQDEEKNEDEPNKKNGKNRNKNALKRVSKMLTSPLTKRLSLAKNMEELLDLSEHSGGLQL